MYTRAALCITSGLRVGQVSAHPQTTVYLWVCPLGLDSGGRRSGRGAPPHGPFSPGSVPGL